MTIAHQATMPNGDRVTCGTNKWLALLIAALALISVVRAAPAQDQPAAANPTAAANSPSIRTLPARIDPNAQPILDRMFRALGGQAFLDFKTLTTQGRLFSLGRGGEGFVYFDSQTQYPDKRRLVYGISKKARVITVINNGDQGWEIDRMGTVHLDSVEIRRWKFANRYSLENLLRLRIHEPGVLVQSAGGDFVNNLAVGILEIVDTEQTQIKLYIDKRTDLPAEVWYRKWNPALNDWDEYTDIYADYRMLQGINTPLHITRSLNGERFSEVYRNTGTYNETYPAQLFADPSPVLQ
jgi:hypothetical protein